MDSDFWAHLTQSSFRENPFKTGFIKETPSKTVVQPPPACLSSTCEKVKKVIDELLETELAYVESLHDVKKGYIEPLRKEKSFSVSDEKKVFSNLTDIAAFHSDFLQRLKQCGQHVDSLARIFCDSANCLLRLYSPYCVSYMSALSHLESMRSREPMKWQCIAACQQRLQHSLPLATYLLKPIQRILKYHLLLQEMCKSGSVSCPRHGVEGSAWIQRSTQSMLQVAERLNAAMQMHQLNERLLHHLGQMNHPRLPPTLVRQLGTLLLCDHFRVTGKRRPRFVWLFYSAMLLGKPRNSTTDTLTSFASADHVTQSVQGAAAMTANGLVLKEVIQCKNLMLIESISDEPLCFHVVPFDNPKNQITLQAQSMPQKRLWCQQIKRLILDHYDKAIPDRARSVLLSIGDDGASRDAVEDSLSLAAMEAAIIEDDRLSLNHEILQALHVYQHRRQPSSVTLDLISLWDNVVNSSSRMDATPKPAPVTTPKMETSSTNAVTPSAAPSSMALLETMDFRYIAVEINEERFLANPMHFRQSLKEEKKHTIPSSLGTLGKTPHSPEPRKCSLMSSSVSVTSSSSECMSTEPLNGLKGQMRHDVYEAYIARARSNVELTLDDLEEIFRPLRELRSSASAACNTPSIGNSKNGQSQTSLLSPREEVVKHKKVVSLISESAPLTPSKSLQAFQESDKKPTVSTAVPSLRTCGSQESLKARASSPLPVQSTNGLRASGPRNSLPSSVLQSPTSRTLAGNSGSDRHSVVTRSQVTQLRSTPATPSVTTSSSRNGAKPAPNQKSSTSVSSVAASPAKKSPPQFGAPTAARKLPTQQNVSSLSTLNNTPKSPKTSSVPALAPVKPPRLGSPEQEAKGNPNEDSLPPKGLVSSMRNRFQN